MNTNLNNAIIIKNQFSKEDRMKNNLSLKDNLHLLADHSFDTVFPDLHEDNTKYLNAVEAYRKAKFNVDYVEQNQRSNNSTVFNFVKELASHLSLLIDGEKELYRKANLYYSTTDKSIRAAIDLKNQLMKITYVNSTPSYDLKKVIENIEIKDDNIVFTVSSYVDNSVASKRVTNHSLPLLAFSDIDVYLEARRLELLLEQQKKNFKDRASKEKNSLKNKVERKRSYVYAENKEPIILVEGTVFDGDSFRKDILSLSPERLGELYYPYDAVKTLLNFKENTKTTLFIEEIEVNFLKPLNELLIKAQVVGMTLSDQLIYKNHKSTFESIMIDYLKK